MTYNVLSGTLSLYTTKHTTTCSMFTRWKRPFTQLQPSLRTHHDTFESVRRRITPQIITPFHTGLTHRF